MKEPRIVLLERDDFARELYTSYLVADGFRVRAEALFDDAVSALKKGGVPLLVAGIAPGGATVAQLYAAIRRVSPHTMLLALLGRDAAEGTMRAVRDGALEALTKPVSAEALDLGVRRCLQTTALLDRLPVMRYQVELYLAAQRLQRAGDAATVAEQLLELALPSAGSEAGLVVRPGDGGTGEILAARGLDEAMARELAVGLDLRLCVDADGVVGRFVAGTGPLASLKGRAAKLATELTVVRVGPRGQERMLALLCQGAKAAAVAAARDEATRSRADAELALYAEQAAFALGAAARYPEGAKEASIDPLTDLFDARYLQRTLEHEIHRARKNGGGRVAVLSVDIDHFREVNAEHGHLVGGQALVEASRVLSRAVRDVDIVARTSADEFGVLLFSTDATGAERAGERIRAAFERHRFLAREGLDLRMSVSIGVAAYPDHGASAAALLQAAEDAAQSVKAAQRNGVALATPPAAPGRRPARS